MLLGLGARAPLMTVLVILSLYLVSPGEGGISILNRAANERRRGGASAGFRPTHK